jgi:hypothetical protein
MAAHLILDTDLDTLAHRLTAGIESSLEAAIKEKLIAQTDPIISSIAKQIAKNIRTKILMYREFQQGEVRISIQIDGKTLKDLTNE